MHIARIFDTPIYLNRITGVEFSNIQNEIAHCVSSVDFGEAYKGWGKTTDVTPLEGDIVGEQNLSLFDQMVMKNIEQFSSSVCFPPKPIANRKSWLTKNGKNGYTPVHNHPTSDVSGCYYYKTNEKDGSIFFLNPTLAATTSYFLQFMPSYVTREPTEGLLILFPAYILHGVQTNETDEERISLAFSLTFER